MKIVAISDTHGQHHSLQLPEGDMIIHAGDVSKRGSMNQVTDFLTWYTQLNFRYKVLIAGNHDFIFETDSKEVEEMIPDNIKYLNDSGVEFEGIKIWGSPVQPWFYDWAFNRQRGDEIQKHWDLIPAETDLLITHGPVFGILDSNIYNDSVGCKNLLETVLKIKPKVHISGHIHEGYGQKEKFGIRFINASVLDEKYLMVNKPIKFELQTKDKTINS